LSAGERGAVHCVVQQVVWAAERKRAGVLEALDGAGSVEVGCGREINTINQCIQVQMERKVDNMGLELSTVKVRGAGSGSKRPYH
jgi:hypothetical protein